MNLTLKDIAISMGYLPANVFGGLSSIFLGSSKRKKDKIVKDEEGRPVINGSILKLVAELVQYLGYSATDLIYEHKKAIAIAAWLSLATGGAVALTLFLWPAALTAVASYSVMGYSIAGIVGANTTAQIGLAAVLSGAVVSAKTYLTATVVNAITWLTKCCKPSAALPPLVDVEENDHYTPYHNPQLKRETTVSGVQLEPAAQAPEPQQTAQLYTLFKPEIPVADISNPETPDQSTQAGLN